MFSHDTRFDAAVGRLLNELAVCKTSYRTPCERSRVVLIDGPSGAGKSTFASELVSAWPRPVTLIRLDDMYPGWHGLDAASTQVAALLDAFRSGAVSRWRRFDWQLDKPSEWVTVDVTRDLVIEGCGSVSRASARRADARVWVTASDTVRKPRALERDAGGFDDYWELWDEQFQRFYWRERPQLLCEFTLETTLASPRWRRTVVGMTDSATYTALFLDGPLEGRAEERTLDENGDYERRFSAYALVNSIESQFWYEAVDSRDVEGQLQVRFKFDDSGSDPVNGGLPNDQESLDPAGP